MKKILVTGGAGFIGSHLCKFLLEKGETVFCLDNFFTGNKHNIIKLIENKNFTLIEKDITEKIEIEVDEIYNLACPASPIHYQLNPIQTTKTCVLGTLNMLELAKKNKAKIFQASTSEIYGNPNIHPQPEEYWGNVNSIGIRSCYDEGKRCAETLMIDFHRQHNIDIKIGRIFNTYGPNMAINDGRVISNFIVQALKNESITIYGNGTQTRSFCFINDMITGITTLMNSNYNLPINLGNDDEISIINLAERIIQLTNSNSKIVFKELPADDPIKRKPDLTKAKEILNWEAEYSLNDGLLQTINYFKKAL